MSSKFSARVALCQPVYQAVDPLCVEALHYLKMQSVGADGEPLVRTYHQVQGRPVAESRNALTRAALATNATHLLWIDADMVMNADSLEKLLDRNLPFVGGLCFNRWPPYHPIAGRHFDPSWGFDPMVLGWVYDHPREGLLDVDVTGGAFLLIAREVFERIRAQEAPDDPRWASWWTPTVYENAEDFALCHRAKSAGHSLYIDCSVRIGHVGRVVIDEEFSRRNRQFEALKAQPMLVPFRRDELDDAERSTKPVVSIVIPVLDQEPEILRATVMSARSQTWPVEVIVIDDGSTVPVEQVLTDLLALDDPAHPLRVVRHPDGKNHGAAASLNLGIEAATTDWICCLSSNDLLLPHKVEAQWLAMHSANALAGFHGFNALVDNGRTAVKQPQVSSIKNMDEQRAYLTRSCYINGSTTMIHRSVFADVGRFDTSFCRAHGWELWCRIGQKYEWHYVSETLGTRREVTASQALEIKRESYDLRHEEEDRLKQAYTALDSCALLSKIAGHLTDVEWRALPSWLTACVRAVLESPDPNGVVHGSSHGK